MNKPILGPKGNPLKQKGDKYCPSDFTISRTMLTLLSMMYGVKRATISSNFSRAGKKASNFEDVIEYIHNGGTFNK